MFNKFDHVKYTRTLHIVMYVSMNVIRSSPCSIYVTHDSMYTRRISRIWKSEKQLSSTDNGQTIVYISLYATSM